MRDGVPVCTSAWDWDRTGVRGLREQKTTAGRSGSCLNGYPSGFALFLFGWGRRKVAQFWLEAVFVDLSLHDQGPDLVEQTLVAVFAERFFDAEWFIQICPFFHRNHRSDLGIRCAIPGFGKDISGQPALLCRRQDVRLHEVEVILVL